MKLKDFLKVCKHLSYVDIYEEDSLDFVQNVVPGWKALDPKYRNCTVAYIKISVRGNLMVYIKKEDPQ